MTTEDTLIDGYSTRLTGDQVRFIRTVLNESRATFSRRFAVQPPVIYRLENKRDKFEDGPLVILIKQLADQYAIQIPEQPIRRDLRTVETAAAE